MSARAELEFGRRRLPRGIVLANGKIRVLALVEVTVGADEAERDVKNLLTVIIALREIAHVRRIETLMSVFKKNTRVHLIRNLIIYMQLPTNY
jgi:hypothetical protein